MGWGISYEFMKIGEANFYGFVCPGHSSIPNFPAIENQRQSKSTAGLFVIQIR